MKLEAEELAILANFTHTVNDAAEGAFVAARLDPIGSGEKSTSRIRGPVFIGLGAPHVHVFS